MPLPAPLPSYDDLWVNARNVIAFQCVIDVVQLVAREERSCPTGWCRKVSRRGWPPSIFWWGSDANSNLEKKTMTDDAAGLRTGDGGYDGPDQGYRPQSGLT